MLAKSENAKIVDHARSQGGADRQCFRIRKADARANLDPSVSQSNLPPPPVAMPPPREQPRRQRNQMPPKGGSSRIWNPTPLDRRVTAPAASQSGKTLSRAGKSRAPTFSVSAQNVANALCVSRRVIGRHICAWVAPDDKFEVHGIADLVICGDHGVNECISQARRISAERTDEITNITTLHLRRGKGYLASLARDI